MAACCPLASACTCDAPPWDAGGALGCSVESGGDGWREKLKALSAANLSLQWSHCGSKMQSHAGTVRRLLGTEGAKPLSIALP